MANSLESLSEELLDRIVSFITSPPNLAVVARLSKQFNRIALPYLYAKVSFDGAWADTGTKHLRSLTLLMLQRPDLAALVKSFSHRFMFGTEQKDDLPEGDAPQCGPQDPKMYEIFKSAIDKYEESEDMSKEWLRAVMEGRNEAAIVALLLPSLLNLQSLDAPFDIEVDSHGYGVNSDYIMAMLDLAGRDKRAFSKLTDVIIPGTNEK